MRRSHETLARLQVLGMFGIVGGFVLATIASTATARVIDREASAIAEKAMPSVRDLTLARAELHSLDTYLHRTRALEGHPSQERVREYSVNLERALSSYRSYEPFAGEKARWEELDAARLSFDQSVERVLAASTPGANTVASIDESHEADRLDDELRELVDFNVEIGTQLAGQAQRARARAARLAFFFDGVTLLLAVAGTIIALVMQRRAVRDLEDESRSAQDRARELGALAAELELFSSRVAHDVLSPLMTVGLALESVRGELRNERSLVMVGRAQRSLVRVRHLVEGLLRFARAGAKPDTAATAEVGEVAASVLEGAASDAETARVRLQPESIDRCAVRCSVGALTSILSNLVTNAIKYMTGAERRVMVRAARKNEVVRIEVEDTGPGIPASLQETLFDPFVRGTTQTGIGLGLATVKRLVESHGGTVRYRSTEHGTTFIVVLPAV
jgi:signal transduction histidine kinase